MKDSQRRIQRLEGEYYESEDKDFIIPVSAEN